MSHTGVPVDIQNLIQMQAQKKATNYIMHFRQTNHQAYILFKSRPSIMYKTLSISIDCKSFQFNGETQVVTIEVMLKLYYNVLVNSRIMEWVTKRGKDYIH